MDNIQSLTHTKWEGKYYIVWILKYLEREIIWANTDIFGITIQGISVPEKSVRL
jgi:hypothetical protein